MQYYYIIIPLNRTLNHRDMQNYIDDEPKLFLRDIALAIIKQAKQYLGQSVLIENKQYKLAQIENSDHIINADTTSKHLIFGTLISSDRLENPF